MDPATQDTSDTSARGHCPELGGLEITVAPSGRAESYLEDSIFVAEHRSSKGRHFLKGICNNGCFPSRCHLRGWWLCLLPQPCFLVPLTLVHIKGYMSTQRASPEKAISIMFSAGLSVSVICLSSVCLSPFPLFFWWRNSP